MELIQIFVIAVVVFLVVSLYKEIFNPAFTFFICVVALLLVGVLSPTDLLKGLSNPQIIIIFLLMQVTAGVRSIFGSEFFIKVFSTSLSPKRFLLRMMMVSSTFSAFLNNTPLVAFMIPYVKDWAERTGNSSSKFLIPLSYATILGGMMTVIGTSTNLVLSGLLTEYNLPLLKFTDFLYLGLAVTVTGWIYLMFVGYKLLPDHSNKIDFVREHLKEYIVETEIFHNSPLIGKSVKDAGLRNLQELFLVEIIRKEKIISPVSPEVVLEAEDTLFFSGNTQSIFNMIKEDNGLQIPKHEKIQEQFNFVEAVIPANSDLIGARIKDSDFRKRYNASIVAIHRDGRRVAGKVGELVLSGGDFLLLLAGENGEQRKNEKNLFFISVPKALVTKQSSWLKWLGLGSILALILGITGVINLFTICVLILLALVLPGVLKIKDITQNIDTGLLMVLVCSLAIGVALEKSGTAALMATGILKMGSLMGPVGVISILFIATIFLTALITNAAAVSIVFPIALALASQTQLPTTPFFVAIAFAASGDFMTPIGYQTNLMVYGPGGYTFKDFFRVGTPLTVIYVAICVLFIAFYYNLI